ncbi:uncharacterized protein [Spinacia oleracea]|uniref:RNase H type-1 domain-containing protein n=1 Tax=Spinacia oleracea TaxID=3562 RepID=A0A9R0IPS4_SPIOL|nr:uncharacterized protein LOC110791887 [Spinacia oleracea]
MGERSRRQRENTSWCPPTEGTVKINVDAAIYGDDGASLGVVIRNHTGGVIRVGVRLVRSKWNVVIAEAKAMVFGLQLASQCNSSSIINESDCLEVIKKMKERDLGCSQLGMILREVDKLASLFNNGLFSHVFRETNEAAHTMARIQPL